jgi:Ca2+/Na+ antiporter
VVVVFSLALARRRILLFEDLRLVQMLYSMVVFLIIIVRLDLDWNEEDESSASTESNAQATTSSDEVEDPEHCFLSKQMIHLPHSSPNLVVRFSRPTASDADSIHEDWEKVEAEDDEEDDHGIQHLNESQVLEKQDTPTRHMHSSKSDV